jgi:hypothetical protein
VCSLLDRNMVAPTLHLFSISKISVSLCIEGMSQEITFQLLSTTLSYVRCFQQNCLSSLKKGWSVSYGASVWSFGIARLE